MILTKALAGEEAQLKNKFMKEFQEVEKSGFETMAASMEFVDNYNKWILGKFSPFMGKHFLEIGTGQGNFKKMLVSESISYLSVDIDRSVIERAKQRDPNGMYLIADVASSEFTGIMRGRKIDTIICINVLEHIHNQKAALDNLMEVLVPGGHLLLFSPAFMNLYNDLDKLAGHERRYTRKDICKLLENGDNSEILVNEYFNPVGAVGWWLNKFISHKNINSNNVNRQVLLFDKYVIPFSKILNVFTKRILGQSVYCVIRKKFL